MNHLASRFQELVRRSSERDDESFHNKGVKLLRVPGFGLPIDHTVSYNVKEPSVAFRHGISDFRGNRITAREVQMLRLMEAIMEKPDWHKKVFNEEITNRYFEEICNEEGSLISEESFEWCLRELRDKAKDFEKNHYITTFESASRCVKSDLLVDGSLREQIIKAVQPLLQAPNKDWHPGSDDKVLNLVHPSLYPLMYGRTRILDAETVGMKNFQEYFGKGKVVPGDQPLVTGNMRDRDYRDIQLDGLWSKKFQWLPCEVAFSADSGPAVEIQSYINNLHPLWNKQLYEIVEKLIAISIPLWNDVLNVTDKPLVPQRIPVGEQFGAECDPPRPDWMYSGGGQDSEERIKRTEDYLQLPDRPGYESDSDEEPFPDDWKEEWGVWGAVEWKWKRIREILHPEPNLDHYETWKNGKLAPELKLEEKFRADGLQIIVKLASIELTPEASEYDGGNWHLEGMLNEHIVATAIYYYDVENISEARIGFRAEAHLEDMDMDYEQNDHEGLEAVLGANSMRDEPAVQEFGTIQTPQGRLLIFPNTMQHKVEPFGLIDKTKPGHRRFILLWLVDPHYRIMSTANVPPQQREWWAREAQQTPWKLPAELTKMVIDHAEDWLIGLDEAKEMRLELMQERTVFTDTVERNFEEYNLCEH